MGACAFEQNAIVKIQGAEHRLLRKVTPALWQIEDVRTGELERVEHARLLSMYDEKILVFPSSGNVTHCGPADSAISPENHRAAVVRLAYVRAALSAPRTRAGLKQSITELWNRTKEPATAPGYVSVHRWIRTYLKHNQDYRVLIDHNHAKGNRTRRFEREVLEICQRSIETTYLRRERTGLQRTLDDAVMRVTEANMLRLPSMQLRLPTRRLLQSLVDRIPAYDKLAARYGRETARKMYRSSKGRILTEHPLDRAEIDHTVLDICVVDDETSKPIGRPYVTACIDVHTRCVLGIYVGFNPPSYQTVQLCLKDCIRPKVWLKKEYPEIKSDWPAHGRMRDLVVDGGLEFHGTSLEKTCDSIGVNIVACPRLTPWAKGHIERFLGTLNRAVTEGVPGTTFRSIEERGDYDPLKHACVTLETLKKNILQWIADYYHQRPHSSLEASPNEAWNSGISPDEICYPDESVDLEAATGSAHLRTVTHKGIEFDGLIYNSPELDALRRLEGAKLKVEIRVNESDLGSIYVLWPDNPKPIEVPAQEIQYASGLSLYAHKVNRARQKDNPNLDQGAAGRMQVMKDISRRIAEDGARKRKQMSKRVQRYREGSPNARAQCVPFESDEVWPTVDEPVTVDAYFEEVQICDQAGTHHEDLGDDLPSLTTTYRGDV